MTDIFFPADVPVAKVAPRLIDSTGRFTSPLNGAVRTVSRPGSRWGMRLDFQNLYQRDRARLEAFVARMRGAENRALISPPDYQQRGSFPSAELFTNNDFSSGATVWNAAGAGCGISGLDRRLRVSYLGSGQVSVNQTVTGLTANMPYVARYAYEEGLGGILGAAAVQCFAEGTGVSAHVPAAEGLSVVDIVVDSASGTQYVAWGAGGAGLLPTGFMAASYIDCVWTSLSQCALVDNGGNLLLQSDTFGSPWGVSAASVAANIHTSADGTATAAGITDTVANSPHYVWQSSVALPAASGSDMMVCGEFHQSNQSKVWLEIIEATGSTTVGAWFDLAAGVKLSTIVGANWANARSFVAPLSNGWFYCCLVARKTNAATTGTAQFGPTTTDGVTTYTGTGTEAIMARRVTCAQSSVPSRQIQTTTAAVSPLAQTGSAYYVKGLPPSTQGLLLPGDWFEVNKELKRCTAQLDSDAAGRGYLQFSPPIRTSANDDDPVIVNRPMGRFLLSAPENGWQTDPGFVSTSSLDFVEAA